MAILGLVIIGSSGGTAPHARGQGLEPILQPAPVVVLADREVCSLLSDAKQVAGVVGQDGGGSVEIDGVVYWTFGDTVLSDGKVIPNAIGWSDDDDASDCIDLTPKQADERVQPLLPRADGERTAWPLGMELTSGLKARLYFASVVSDPETTWRSQGVGLASFDAKTVTATRELDGGLLWSDSTGFRVPNARTFADEDYVHVFLTVPDGWSTGSVLARVALGDAPNPESYEYWDDSTGQWVSGLWDGATQSWDPAITDLESLWWQAGLHNGVDVAYNEFLERWLAVYSASFLTTTNFRTGEALTGPWDDVETVGVRCELFHPPPHEPFGCYSAIQHPEYTKDGGRTIYVTYSNSRTYRVYLHEVRLAARVYEWLDGDGAAAYLPDSSDAPGGLTKGDLAFYASDIPVPGFAAVHGWQDSDSGAVRYGTESPGEGFDDEGVAFYAPADVEAAAMTNALYAPVYRWVGDGGDERYSPMNLAMAGYAPMEIAFYSACPDTDQDGATDCAESFAMLPLDAVDTDVDGCSDAREVNAPRLMGGGRNPLRYWDFFDTPNQTNERDGVINVGDILRVVVRFGTSGNPNVSPLLGAELLGNTYHPAFDRGSPQRTSPANSAAADGGINLIDIVAIAKQFGHRCTRHS